MNDGYYWIRIDDECVEVVLIEDGCVYRIGSDCFLYLDLDAGEMRGAFNSYKVEIIRQVE